MSARSPLLAVLFALLAALLPSTALATDPVASLVWDDGAIIAADGSLGTGGSATTHVTAYDAQHHPLAGVHVDIWFPIQSVGSTSSVTLPSGCAASTVTFGGGFVSCTTDATGRVPVQFIASGAVLPVGTTETIEARVFEPGVFGPIIAQATYRYLVPSSLVWDDGAIIAADGSLGTGGSATTHVTAYDAQHHPLAGVHVDIWFPIQSVGSTSSVTLPSGCAASTVTFGGGFVSCTTDATGRVPVQFIASGAVLPVGTTETIEARVFEPGVFGPIIAQATYRYLVPSSLVWDDGAIIAADGSLGTGGSATTHVTAYDAQHHPLAGVHVDIWFPIQSVGSTSSVTLPSGCAASTVTFGGGFVSCTTDATGRVPVQFIASGAVLPVGTTETIEARVFEPGVFGPIIAQATYSYQASPGTPGDIRALIWEDDGGFVAPDGSLGIGGTATARVRAYDGQHAPVAGRHVLIALPPSSPTSHIAPVDGACTITGPNDLDCITDVDGHVTITYTASGVPQPTEESIIANDAAGRASDVTRYRYADIRALIWEDDGGFVAPDGSLGIGGTATARVRAYDGQHAPVAGRHVLIALPPSSPTSHIAPVDGACTITGPNDLDCITDVDGHVTITYTASGVPQPTEESIIANDAAGRASDVTRYRYADIRALIWEDDGGFVAPDGSLGIGGTATARVRAYDGQHAPVAGRHVLIALPPSSPTSHIAPVDGACTITGPNDLDCITDVDGHVTITYTASGVPQPTEESIIANDAAGRASDVTRYRYGSPPPPAPSLTFDKSEDAASVIAGAGIGFIVTLSNSAAAGTGHATIVTIADPLPATAGLTWSLAPYSGPGTCTLSGDAGAQRVDCGAADLAPGEAIAFHVTSPTTTASCGTSTNEATASAANASTLVRTAGVSIVCPTTTDVTTELTSGAAQGTSLTIPAGATITDQATIGGSEASSATGAITYTVYSDNACGTPVAAGGTKSVSGGSVGASDPVTLASAGTYWFVAAYSGDPTHLASHSGCADEVVHVVGAITATGLTATSPLAFSGSVATFTSATPGAAAGHFTATIDWGDGTPTSAGAIASASGLFTVSGGHAYASTGVKTVGVTIHGPAGTSATATSTITVFAVAAGGGAFVISDRATTGTVTFWSPQWAKANPVAGGRASDTFKGYAKLPATPSCGTAWSTDPGNSGPPPAAPLPAYIAVVVTNTVTRSGSQIGGTTTSIVLVRTNPGYNPATGGAGSGTVVAAIC